jgi:glycosyltransferase involved in cell wall biosynthesis
MHYTFIYPQIKKLTGAQRLILALAGAVAETDQVTLLTHRFAPECRPALSPKINLIESGANLNRTGNHYFDSLIEYGSVPALIKRIPQDSGAICFFGPPSLPGLLWAKWRLRPRRQLLYFCYEPPRAAYTDRKEVSQRMGKIGLVMRGLLWLYRPLDRFLARQADTVLVNSRYVQGIIKQTYGLDSTVITHGVDLPVPPNLAETVACIRQKWGLDGRKVIITVNHLHPRKRVDLLLRAMPDILKQHPEATALIIGIGPEEAHLKNLARELGLTAQQVVFAGFVPEAELAAYYTLADVYAHMCREESFGLSVLEASANGLPVVAANEGGVGEIVQEGVSGFLVPAIVTNFVEQICWLLAHPEKAKAMGEAGKQISNKKYTWQLGADKLRVTSYELRNTEER